MHTYTHKDFSHKPTSRELISWHNNYVCEHNIANEHLCRGQNNNHPWLSAASPRIYSPCSTCFSRSSHVALSLGLTGGRAVNQRFALLCPISPSWWILTGTYLALQWWRAGRGLLDLHCTGTLIKSCFIAVETHISSELMKKPRSGFIFLIFYLQNWLSNNSLNLDLNKVVKSFCFWFESIFLETNFTF